MRRSIDNDRWVQSIRQECLDHFLVFGPQHFDHVISEYMEYYHTERPHQSLENKPLVRYWPEPKRERPPDGQIVCRSRLGGWVRSYERKAA